MQRKTINRFAHIIAALAIFMILGVSAVADKTDPGTPIDNLSFQGAEIRSVITFLADYGKVNVVVAPNVQGTVTIKLRNVTWDQALKIVGETYNLAVVFEDDDKYIRVVPADEYRKEIEDIEKHNFEKDNLVRLQVKIVKLSNTAAKDIATSVKSLMTPRGTVDSDDRSNSLILQEVPDNIDKVIEYIKELDKPARQIHISAQLIEIYSTDDFEWGVNWDAAGSFTSDDGDYSATQSGNLNGGNRVSDPYGTYRVGQVFKGWDLNTLVSTIIKEGKGKIIAHPEITTVENKEARIQMGQKVPIKEFDQAGNLVTKFEEIGTILRVTPHITADNQILMHLMPERSSLEPDAAGIIINTNNAETHVVVNDGQTAIIGGLVTEDEVESEAGIPILKDIPLLGYVFKYTTKSSEKRELMIFITPTVVENDLANTGP